MTELSTLGIGGWNNGNSKTRGKPTKLDLITEISELTKTKSLDISVLTIKDIRVILKYVNSGNRVTAEVPEDSKFKKPYIEILEPELPDVKNLKKLSVNSLKELLGAITK